MAFGWYRQVELVELQVGHSTARTPGHGNAVTAGAVRVAGVEIRLAGAAGCQHHGPGLEQIYPVAFTVEYVSALAAAFTGNQVYRDAVRKNLNVVGRKHTFGENLRNCSTGAIGCVDNAPVTVAPLHGQVELAAGALAQVEVDTLLNQPLDTGATVAHGEVHGLRVAQSRTGDQCVGHVRVHGVG